MTITSWILLYSICVMTNVMVFSMIVMTFLFTNPDELFEFTGYGDDFFKRFFYMVIPVINVVFVFRMIYNAAMAFLQIRKKKKSLSKFLDSMADSRKAAKAMMMEKTPLSDSEYLEHREELLANVSNIPALSPLDRHMCDCGTSTTVYGASLYSRCPICNTLVQNKF